MGNLDWPSVVAAASSAPSICNSQPWLFVADTDRLDVFLDPARALPVVDPTGRQQIMSVGAAVELARIAITARGQGAQVDLAPEGPSSDHLAALHVRQPRGPSLTDRELWQAIPRRHTVRTAFDARPVPASLIETLADEALQFDVWVKPVTRDDEIPAAAALIAHAEEIERRDPAYLAELECWIRPGPDAVDGIPVDALPPGDPATRPSQWPVRDYLAGRHPQHAFIPAGDPDADPPDVERPTVLLLVTENDDRLAWLQAGRALGRILLRATAEGLVASPLALDLPLTRIRLREELALLGQPQLLLRMGFPNHAATAPVVTGRRPVAEVLRWTHSD